MVLKTSAPLGQGMESLTPLSLVGVGLGRLRIPCSPRHFSDAFTWEVLVFGTLFDLPPHPKATNIKH